MSSDEISRLTGVSQSMAKRLLLALNDGAYLTKTGKRSFEITTFSRDQVDEWHLALGAIIEIGALRMCLTGDSRIDTAEAFLEANLRNTSVEDEGYFMSAISLTTLILGGPRSSLPPLVEQIIPQAFFRLLWLATGLSNRGSYLVEVADRVITAARSKDLEGVRKSVRSFFDSTALALHGLIDLLAEGGPIPTPKTGGLQMIEPQLSGAPTHFGSSRMTVDLLGLLPSHDRIAFSL